MTILETSQIIFNLVISLAVVTVAVLISVIAYDLIRFIKAVKKFAEGVNKESAELYEKLNNFLETMTKMSFISKFFNHKKKK